MSLHITLHRITEPDVLLEAYQTSTASWPVPPGRIPVAAEKGLKDFDPAAPLHRGWDTYRYAQKEVDAGVAAETSLERAMRLRQEFLDALKECGAAAAQGCSFSERGDRPASQVLKSGLCPLSAAFGAIRLVETSPCTSSVVT